MFGGIRSPYLGIQVLGIMGVGLGFAGLTVLSVIRTIDNRYRQRRIGWCALAVVSALCGLTLYGWAWTGHPLRLWGLA